MKRKYKCSRMTLILAMMLIISAIVSQAQIEAKAAEKTTVYIDSNIIEEKGETRIHLKNKRSKASYIFSSDKKSVASVSKKGIVTGKNAGTAKVTVKQKYKGKITKLRTFHITVVDSDSPLVELKFKWETEKWANYNKKENTLELDACESFVEPMDPVPYEYSGPYKAMSSNPETVSVVSVEVDKKTDHTYLIMKTLKPGTATISIQAGKFEKSFMIVVRDYNK
ncbi:MAG: Ig domain-containing protein [Agathobacter sp.]